MDNLSVSAISFAKQIYNQINDPNNGTVINNSVSTNIFGSNKVIAGSRSVASGNNVFTYRLTNGGTQYQPDLFCYMSDTGLCSLVFGSSSNASSTSFIYPSLGFTTINSANQHILTARIHITMNHSAGSEAGSLRFSTKASSGSLTERFAIGSTGESHFLFTNGNAIAKFMHNTTASTSTFELCTLYNGTSVKNISLINKEYVSSSPTSAIFKLQKTDFSFTARIGQGSEEKEVIVFSSDVTRNPKIFTVNTDTDDGIFVVSAQHLLSFDTQGSWMSIEPDLLSIGVSRTDTIFIGDGDLSTFIINMGGSNTLEIRNKVYISHSLHVLDGINIGAGYVKEKILDRFASNGIPTIMSEAPFVGISEVRCYAHGLPSGSKIISVDILYKVSNTSTHDDAAMWVEISPMASSDTYRVGFNNTNIYIAWSLISYDNFTNPIRIIIRYI
jgi:hypothetical protein